MGGCEGVGGYGRTGVRALWRCSDGYKTTTTAIDATRTPRLAKRAIERPLITCNRQI